MTRTREELLAHYVGWEEEVQQVLQCVEQPSLWAINALDGFPISVHRRIAIAGDAVSVVLFISTLSFPISFTEGAT